MDLLELLVRRGMKASAAAAYLDTSPALAASVWVKAGISHRGAHLEGYAAVVLDKGRERGAFLPEGKPNSWAHQLSDKEQTSHCCAVCCPAYVWLPLRRVAAPASILCKADWCCPQHVQYQRALDAAPIRKAC